MNIYFNRSACRKLKFCATTTGIHPRLDARSLMSARGCSQVREAISSRTNFDPMDGEMLNKISWSRALVANSRRYFMLCIGFPGNGDFVWFSVEISERFLRKRNRRGLYFNWHCRGKWNCGIRGFAKVSKPLVSEMRNRDFNDVLNIIRCFEHASLLMNRFLNFSI